MAHCKDCKHFETIISNGEETSFCNDEIYHRATVYPDSGECKSFVPIDYKELFWQWLQENTNFTVWRKHHKIDIENALDYVISKMVPAHESEKIKIVDDYLEQGG